MTKRFSVYLFKEILPLYGAGLAVLLVLLLGSFLLGVLADVIARGVPPSLVARFLLYKLPAAAGAGIPLALLFASLLGLTRLGQDSEIKAAMVLGLSPREFAVPMLLLGVAVSLLSFFNNELIVPRSERLALEAQKDILLQSPDTFLEEGSFFTDALGRSIFIEKLEPGGAFRNVTVIQAGNSQGPKEMIQAERGTPDEANGVWQLEGIRFRTFRNSKVVLDATAEHASLPIRELTAGASSTPELIYLPLNELFRRVRESTDRYQPAEWTAIHRKFAEPLAATAFALFALSVGLFSFRSGAGLGMVSVLFLTFIYYATWSVANLLGAQGTVPAWFAGWLPVLLYAVAGSVLFAFTWRR